MVSESIRPSKGCEIEVIGYTTPAGVRLRNLTPYEELWGQIRAAEWVIANCQDDEGRTLAETRLQKHHRDGYRQAKRMHQHALDTMSKAPTLSEIRADLNHLTNMREHLRAIKNKTEAAELKRQQALAGLERLIQQRIEQTRRMQR
jgi:hypothetical protein